MWITYYRSYSWSSSWGCWLDPLMDALAGEYDMNTYFGYLSYIMGILVLLLVSAITMFLIIRRVKKLDMTSALKEKEV